MKTDRRVAYTKMVLKKSFLELIHEKPVSKITVKEICERADINRATFYSHFNDVYDMLGQIENELYETIRHTLDKGWKTNSITELLMAVCTDIKKNEDVCKAVLSENGDKDFLNRALFVAQDKCVSDWKAASPLSDTETLERIYTFFSYGSAAIVLSWVKNGMQESPAEIASFIGEITNKGLGLLQSDLRGQTAWK
ncbi:MAG: TetR/AcrR family transcriptional regulator [Oscillospiraceae bacterium]|nr:TetR/AcrR family transcriptional regulator [Oscillospiraceae bacterium]